MFVKKNFILFASSLRTYLCILCLYEAMEKFSEIITVRVRETTISSDEGFNGTIVNRAMPSFHVDLLEITRALPLNIKIFAEMRNLDGFVSKLSKFDKVGVERFSY